jgi:hypothetical protein
MPHTNSSIAAAPPLTKLMLKRAERRLRRNSRKRATPELKAAYRTAARLVAALIH